MRTGEIKIIAQSVQNIKPNNMNPNRNTYFLSNPKNLVQINCTLSVKCAKSVQKVCKNKTLTI